VPPTEIVALVSPGCRVEVAGHEGTLVAPPSPAALPDPATPLPVPPAPLPTPSPLLAPLADTPVLPELLPLPPPPPLEDPGPAELLPEALISPDAFPAPESASGLNCVAHPTAQTAIAANRPALMGTDPFRGDSVPHRGGLRTYQVTCDRPRH
jgi:hypothetical protein